jgi:hypothetical protein
MNENVARNLDEALNTVLLRAVKEADYSVGADSLMKTTQAACNLANAAATLAQRDMLLAGKL